MLGAGVDAVMGDTRAGQTTRPGWGMAVAEQPIRVPTLLPEMGTIPLRTSFSEQDWAGPGWPDGGSS